jgi:ABC-type multidrug transport system fused ATPase/permease subunit
MVKEMEEIQPIFMPPDNWPMNGDVQANHMTVRYRPELPPVLSDITFNIASGEKIGIVGHTGSGKSTLSLAFFRMVELNSENGSHFAPPLIIDGIDIRKVPLDRLRRSIGIIPQEPVLFSGSLRFNLDPSLKATEAQMWEALKQAGLETWARSKGGLDIQFDPANTTSSTDSLHDSGTHMSMGQRQLLCLSRQLLVKPKVLVMDEATASLDYEADAKIKQVIRQHFHETTIFTIAHRLETILDGDRVMVIDTGNLVEIGTPKSLLQNKKSYFYSLVEHEKQNMK